MTRPPPLPAVTRRRCLALALGLGALALPQAARAQSAVIYGQLGNFDISNDTGRVCHGFQIDIDGVAAVDIPSITYFTANRYGTPVTTPTATGVQVRWSASYNDGAQSWSDRTLPHTVPWFPGQCYQWVTGTYQDGGCEHFGVRTVATPGTVAARWLCEEPSTPGTLLAIDPPTAVAGPVYYVQPPVVLNNPPVVVVEVVAPEPAEVVGQFGDAQWERVFKVDSQRAVALEELVADNPNVVPMDAAQLESDYSILQDEPAGGNGKRKRHRHQSDVAPTTRSIVRRIELYRFTGNYDPITHEALCADGTCKVASAGEVGDLISVQMTAANVIPDAVLVTKTGTGAGSVDSKDKLVACGSKCAANYSVGNVVQLTAKAASGSDFVGWTGACTGTNATCNVTIDGAVAVGAVFNVKAVVAGGGGGGGGGTPSFTLSVGRSNPGTVTGTPAGDKAINCGSVCSAKFASGTVVSLTATPPAGKAFVNWTGACAAAGANPVCSIPVSANLSVQANFSK